MKYFYAGLGIVLLVGVAYASYTYGINKDNIIPANNTVANNTVAPDVDIPVLNDGNPNVNVEAKTVAITSPKNGAVITGDVPFSVSGTVSPNATKIVVEAYSGLAPCFEDGCCEGGEAACRQPKTYKLIDRYTLNKFKLGDTTWSYAISHAYGNAPAVNVADGKYIAIATFSDGTTKSSTINVTYNFAVAEMGKPVIYLYPTKTQLVSVNVKPTSGISYTEPEISATGWQVTANPDGTLIDVAGKVWPYLFWEGYASNFVTPKEGFVVAGNEVSRFFDVKLATLGLNAKEIADFKEFWIPKMADKPYYFITFIPQTVFDKYAPLTVNPAPQTVIRVFFDYKGLDAPIVVPAQILPKTPERTGFTVVEWGGRLYR